LNTGNGLCNVKLNRYANIKEYLKLQGFDVTFNYVISKTQIKKQIGNSINVNVLKAIIFQIF
jgi:site-specific DNA-cytosine methylase